MINSFKTALICLCLIACKREINPKEIAYLNGYWEIEKVVFDSGKEKLYNVNESYDYFELKTDNKGFRKKVMPQLNGTFLVNDTYENISLQFVESTVYIDYSTPFAKWKEEIVSISKDKLVMRIKG